MQKNNDFNRNTLSNEIIEKADIVSIISEYISLEKQGKDYKGLCPFHDDHNASLSVEPNKKCWRCFSCGASGNVISFVSKFKNIPYREAMRIVGESCGIKVHATKHDLERQKNEKYYKILKDAADFYHFYLTKAADSLEALEYLHKRGLSDEIIDKYNIGLCSENDELYKLLKIKGHLEVDMIEVGLINSYSNTYHDRFKNRIMFPLWDLEGNVVGFSGRKYLAKDQDLSKYMNSNDNVIFKKGQLLYNYHNAIDSIKKENQIYLYEGFMDAIASVRAGILNSVASMGTALTNQQIEAMKRFTNNVNVVYDSDDAGFDATMRAIELLNNYEMNVNIVRIPEVKDADEYISKFGAEKLNEVLIHNKQSAMDFLYQSFKKNTLFSDLTSMEIFKNKVFSSLSKYKSNLIIETFINKLSADLKISYESLKADFDAYKKDNPVINQTVNTNPYSNTIPNNNFDLSGLSIPTEDIQPELPIELIEDINNNQVKVSVKKTSNKKYLNSERQLILASYYQKEKCLEIESLLDFAYVDKTNKEILLKLRHYYQKREVINQEELFNSMSDVEKATLIDIINNVEAPDDQLIKIDIDLVRKYPTILQIEIDKNDEKAKDINDLKSLTDMKKRITHIRIKGRK